MGLVYRCSACAKEMVLESFHRGRTVRCPHCREENEAPENLDFATASDAALKDLDRGGLLLFAAIAGSMLVVCAPVPAAVWWMANGAIARAKDEEREVEPAMVWAKWISIIGTGVGVVAYAMLAVANFL